LFDFNAVWAIICRVYNNFRHFYYLTSLNALLNFNIQKRK
jgi:hypothetical protein